MDDIFILLNYGCHIQHFCGLFQPALTISMSSNICTCHTPHSSLSKCSSLFSHFYHTVTDLFCVFLCNFFFFQSPRWVSATWRGQCLAGNRNSMQQIPTEITTFPQHFNPFQPVLAETITKVVIALNQRTRAPPRYAPRTLLNFSTEWQMAL